MQNAARQTQGNSNVTLCTKLAVASCLVARRQRQCMQISSSSLPSELSPVSKQQLAQLDANQNDGRHCSWQGDSLSLDVILTSLLIAQRTLIFMLCLPCATIGGSVVTAYTSDYCECAATCFFFL